jgi:hypothetical protein
MGAWVNTVGAVGEAGVVGGTAEEGREEVVGKREGRVAAEAAEEE